MIDFIINYDINVFAIFLCLILYVVIKIKKDIYRYSTTLVIAIIWATIFALLIEPITWTFDAQQTIFAKIINPVSNSLLVLVTPIIIGLWGSYLDYKIFGNRKRLKKQLYYQVPTILIFILVIVNIFEPIFFSINASNIYSAGPYEWLRYLIIYGTYLYILFIMIYNRKLIQTKVLYGVVAFFVLPFIGSVAQIFESRLFFAFSMLSLAIVVVYIFLETTTGIRDYLTHLYSRRTLEDYMASLIDNNRHFEVLMIDLNHFKLVNDKYGHLAGDQVLIGFGKILQEIFKGEPMVSRLGGDEFFVVIETLNHAAIEKKLDSLIIKMQEHPILNKYGMNKFSAGISDFDGKKTMDDLYSEADKRMYQQKKMLN